MATPKEIDKIIQQHQSSFESKPTYSPTGDCVELYFEDSDCYAERVDCWLTLYRAFDNDRVVGFMLKNVKTLLSRYDALGLECRVTSTSCTIRVRALVAHVPWVDPHSAEREPYRDILQHLSQCCDDEVQLVDT